jgi:hypothetical protein
MSYYWINKKITPEINIYPFKYMKQIILSCFRSNNFILHYEGQLVNLQDEHSDKKTILPKENGRMEPQN